MSRRKDREDEDEADDEPRRSEDSRRPAARRRDREEEDEDDEELEERPRRRRRRRDEEDEDEESGGVARIIPYHNGRALSAYYCGVFSLIPGVGNLLGPLAVILGILGVRYARAHRKAGGTGHAITGIVLGSITTIVWWGAAILLFVLLRPLWNYL
jgi:hypothetical protein